MRIYVIIPGKLYQSRTTVGLEFTDAFEALDDLDVTVVANLWSPKDKRIEQHVSKYLDWPMPDGKYPDFELYEQHAQDLARLISKGEVVLTHCHAGRNRSGLLNAITLMILTGMSGKQAKEFIQAKRPGALANQTFCDLLDELEIQV
jgi:protein-tyrosine phosphatase